MKQVLKHSARAVWIVVGLTALALGAIGVFLPLLPTTPFILLAAFAFAKSSERLHTWLLDHNVFGPMITNWREYGAISRPAKTVAAISMLGVILVSILLGAPMWIVGTQALVLSASALFVLTRPLPPK